MTRVFEIFLQRPTITFLLHWISRIAHCVCIYPHQGMASFYPTSKDSICGAHGRKIGSMHLCYIYCKTKQWIHGDDKSHKLIKIVPICGRWMMECNTPFMNLSLLYLDNMRTWLYIYFFFFFFMGIDVSIFLGHASLACHPFSFF